MLNFLNSYFRDGMVLMIGVLLVLAIAYRYYSAFIAAKVFALDASRPTPAHTMRDGQNYDPTNRWVLFGHHFAAISGAGPLIGPVLAAQYGFMPGLLWILIGVCLAGAVQDFTILVLSTRNGGKSLAQLAYLKIGPVAGTAAVIGILFVLIIALAGLGKVVTKALGGETVKYPAGTQFIAGERPLIPVVQEGKLGGYTIPKGTKITYANGAVIEVSAPFVLSLSDAGFWPNGDAGIRKYTVAAALPAAQAINGSTWGTFTIALTIPIALLTGLYMYRIRKGHVVEASIIGGLLTLGAVWLGGYLDDPNSFMSSFRPYFNLTEGHIALAMAIYGFIASILPVWVLLCPRDYLSSFLKIGTVGLLVVGVILANPKLNAPAINMVFLHGGPAVKFSIFPFVFITIMCGAISGFHALVSSGTTPKMVDKETQTRGIGYGAMLIEGLVGIVALIAAASLPSAQYFEMNTSRDDIPKYQKDVAQVAAEFDRPAPGKSQVQPLSEVEENVGENLKGRTGGAVTLAVGMAKIFDDAAKRILGEASAGVTWLEGMMKYWYHFAIMFEALFILTTIDAGTRVGRFLLQETFGKISPRLGRTDSWLSAVLATGLIVGGWGYFIYSRSMDAIWPMFGVANQMLAVMALAIASVGIAQMGKKRYLAVTILPMCFVALTTTTAATIMLRKYWGDMTEGGWFASTAATSSAISAGCILAIMGCTAVIVCGAVYAIQKACSSRGDGEGGRSADESALTGGAHIQ